MSPLPVSETEAAKLIADRAKHVTIMPATLPPATPGGATIHNLMKAASPEPTSRPLVAVENDLAACLIAQRKNVYKMGALLIEAKAKVTHGEWLPWLAKHFVHGAATAQNYMNAARYRADHPDIEDLKLSINAVYWLATRKDDRPAREVLEAAKTRYVDRQFCYATEESEKRRRSAALGAATRAANKAKEPEPATMKPVYSSIAELNAITPEARAARQAFDRDHLAVSEDVARQDAITVARTERSMERDARDAFRATLSPEELTVLNTVSRHRGEFKGNIKSLVRLIPNKADLVEAPVDDEMLIRAALLLIDVVYKRRLGDFPDREGVAANSGP